MDWQKTFKTYAKSVKFLQQGCQRSNIYHLNSTLVIVKKYTLFIFMLCLSSVLKAQTDTVAAKISKIPVVHVDVLAKFPGGDFTKYIAANINYQKKSDRSLRGQVIISLKIDTNGKVSNVNVLKSVTLQIDQEVVHVIKSSPRWQPALVKGKPIGVYMVFNIDMGVISALAPLTKTTTQPVVPTPELVKKPIIEPVAAAKKNQPIPEKKTEPAPVTIKKKPALKAVKKPAPPFDKKPVPVEKKPLPQVVKKTPMPPVKKAEPAIAKKTSPPTINKTAPAVAKKIIPPPIKKPEPIVVKKPVVPIAKTTLSVKKPTSHVAKVVIPSPPAKKTIIAPVKPDEKKIAAAPIVKHKKPLVAKSLKKADEPTSTLGPSSEAQFPDGGRSGFFRYLSENIHYPILSKINKIEGEVNLTFVVDKDGTVSDVKILNAPAEDLAQEAKRVILATPKWKPAIQNGIPVKEAFTVPINFKIQDNKPSQQ